MPAFSVIAHRGNSTLAPENTFAAFDLALDAVPAFELDVQLTSDGVCVVLHDEKLGRTNNGFGPVAQADMLTISGLDAGSWHGSQYAGCRIPTLREVLDRYRHRAHIYLVGARLLIRSPGQGMGVNPHGIPPVP